MSRLGIKIFCWIWLAFILLLAGFALVVDHLSQDATLQQLGAGQLRQWQQTQERALGIYQRRGLDGLKRFAKDIHDNRGINFFLLDDDAHDLLGQEVPPSVRQYFMAQRHAGLQMQKRDQRLLLGPAAFPDPALTGSVLLWLPVTDINFAPASRLWRGPHPVARLAVALAVSGLVSLLLALSLTRPLRHLQATARALAQGDFDTAEIDAAAKRRDEIGDLARDFRDMAARLKTSLEGRKRLLRDVSHELRSPLARLQAAIELADRQAGPENNLGFSRMENECKRLNAMIGDVLALSRADQDEAATAPQQFDLADTLQTLVSDANFEGQAQHKQVELQAPEQQQYLGHESLISSAVENVLRNALRYTPPESTVTVTLNKQSDRLEISICDAGPGVPEQELGKIFEPFYRISEARERQSGGTGVGLAIAARAAQRHGGKITARNRPTGGLEVVMVLEFLPAHRRYPLPHGQAESRPG